MDSCPNTAGARQGVAVRLEALSCFQVIVIDFLKLLHMFM